MLKDGLPYENAYLLPRHDNVGVMPNFNRVIFTKKRNFSRSKKQRNCAKNYKLIIRREASYFSRLRNCPVIRVAN